MEVKPMDKLARQLKQDAALIEVQVSDELDRRITATLHGIEPEMAKVPQVRQRPAVFWLASSLTGIAAALAVIAIINSHSQFETAPESMAGGSPDTSPVLESMTPTIDWKTESAMLTRPLQRELEDLQADLKKAEEKVKKDIGL
jgi:hypothetical protein